MSEQRRAALVGKAQTVLGPIGSAELGITITHEHLLSHAPHLAKEPIEPEARAIYRQPVSIEILGELRFRRRLNFDNLRLQDIDTAIDEVSRFKRAGGSTLVDATSIGIGRDPAGLARIARATGLNIVMGASYYVEETYPPERCVHERSEDEITQEIVTDIFDGADGTNVRAGIIGEVGCSWPLTDTERKVLRASGRAQRETGAPLTIHPGRHSAAPLEIVDVLREAGADLSRTIMCHIDRTIDRKQSLAALAETGCVLEYDLFGQEHSYNQVDLPVDMPNDGARLCWLAWLIAEGYGRQIVISHDMFFKHQLVRHGGHGYGHIVENVVPYMRRKGFAEADIHAILEENPQRLLAFV